MDLLLFSGQSNMQGQTESLPINSPIPGTQEYRFLTNELVPLAHPVGEDIDGLLLAAHEGHGSLVPAFCRAYVRETGHNVTAVHIARGATAIREWLPDHPSGRYALAIQKAQAAIRTVPDVERIYFLWLQGESDAIENTDSETYMARIRAFRQLLSRDLHIDSFAFLRVGKFVNDERDLVIIRAQESLCQEPGFTMLTRITGQLTQDPAMLNPDAPGHYNNAGMERLGEAAGQNLANLRLGRPLQLEEEPYEELV